MNIEKLFSEALGIKSPWYIKSVNFNSEKKELDIEVDFKRGSTFKDDDNDQDIPREYKAYDTTQKKWRHLNFFEHECNLHVRTPRIKRDDGRVRLISPPWSGAMNGFTLLFEAFIIKLSKDMTISKIADLLKISDDKIWSMLDIYTYGARSKEDYSDVKIIGVDETSIAKGHEYISLFVDLNKKKTIFISKGKSSKTVANFSEDLKDHNAVASQIAEVSCDMSPAFIKGVKEELVNAKITFDKFHILKIINEAVDKVRRAESKGNPLLKGSRYVFLKNDDNLTVKQKQKKEEILISKLNLKSIRAMHIRENFQQIYLAKTTEEFIFLLEKWHSWAVRSQLEPMKKAAKSIKNHWEGIVRWKDSQINNGILEGLNSVLQAAKRRARGYGEEHFKTIAYLITGKLDFSEINEYCLPTHI
jgi:transposase